MILSTMRYSYIYTKLRARKSRFLDTLFYEKLIGAENTVAILRMLSPTPYAGAVTELLSGDIKSETIDKLLVDLYNYEFEMLSRFLPKRARKYAKLYERRAFFDAIRSVIRGKHSGLEPEEIDEYLVLPSSSRKELDKLTSLGTIEQIVDAVPDKLLRKALQQAYTRFTVTGNVTYFELAIDNYYYTTLGEGAKKVLRGLDKKVATQHVLEIIEMLNILTILRGKRHGIPEEELREYTIEQFYKLKYYWHNLLQAKSEVDVLNILEETTYGPILQDYRDASGKISSFRELELGFQKFLYERSKKLWATPFNIGNFLAYFDGRKIETQNLRSILLGKLNGLSGDEIKILY
ncbi:MAG: V-type ATPase subunit [Candidatus Odinarchaeota archaeon]